MFRFDRLRELAKKQHRSMRYLCDIAGKSPSYIVDAEKKGSLPKPDAIKTWATALRTTPAYLMGETDDPGEGIKKNPPLQAGTHWKLFNLQKNFLILHKRIGTNFGSMPIS